MTITVPDDVLRDAGLTERDAQIEFACRLFDAEKLALWPAAQVARLSRVEFEFELRKRNIAVHRVTPEYWQMEVDSLGKLGPPRR